jgi:hypothetical protein
MKSKGRKPQPAAGGSYARLPDGSLRQIEESTAPHPGKVEVARQRALAKAARHKRKSPPSLAVVKKDKTPENSNG